MDEKLLNDFIKYFENDYYRFENFCEVFLRWLGFDDIIVTSKSGDNGIDLRCTKKEIDKIDINNVGYIVQAKCYSLSNKVFAPEIRNFKGTKESLGMRRIFITTSEYTEPAKEEANDPNQPVTLIDGKMIIDYCKSQGDLIFNVKYAFDKTKMDDLFKSDSNASSDHELIKRITKNDVRARILRIPPAYKKELNNKKNYKLSINGEEPKLFNISSDGKYFGGVTAYYKSFIQDNEFNEAHSRWIIDPEKEIIYVNIEN